MASRRTFVVISNMAAVGGVCPFGVVTVLTLEQRLYPTEVHDMMKNEQNEHRNADHFMCRFSHDGIAHENGQSRCHQNVSGCFYLHFHIRIPNRQASHEQPAVYQR